MNPSLRRASALRAVASLSITAALVGCGGDSNNDTTPRPTLSVGDYLVTGESAANTTTGVNLLIVDPDHPAAPRLSIALAARSDYTKVPVSSIDPVGRRSSYFGDSMAYYVKDHQLFQVSLRKADNTVPQRISSLSTACKVADWHPLTYAGPDDVWVEVTEAGSDGDCDLDTDNQTVFVRTGTPAGTAATTLPAGIEVLESLPDESYAALSSFLVSDTREATPKLVLYTKALTPLIDVSGGAGLSSLEILSFTPGAHLTSSVYVRTGMTLRRLTWSASGASLSSDLYTFANPGSSYSGWVSNASEVYFIDGLSILRLDESGRVTPFATLDPANGDSAELSGLSSTHLILRQQAAAPANASTLLALPKSGAAVVPLATGNQYLGSLGMYGDDFLYLTYVSASNRYAIRRVKLDGSNDRTLTDQAAFLPMTVLNRTFSYDSGFSVDAVGWCEPAPGDTDCRNGVVKSLDLSTQTLTTLGAFSHASSPPGTTSWFSSGFAFTGMPLVIQAEIFVFSTSARQTDMYLAEPGKPNSLVRLSSQIP